MSAIIQIIKVILAFISLYFIELKKEDTKMVIYWAFVCLYWTLNFIQGLI